MATHTGSGTHSVHGQNRHLDERAANSFNRHVYLYALVASDSPFAVDVFTSREAAEEALREVLFDEPAFEPLLDIVALPPPWLEDITRALETHRQ